MHRTMISRSQGDKLELDLPLCNLFNHTGGFPSQCVPETPGWRTAVIQSSDPWESGAGGLTFFRVLWTRLFETLSSFAISRMLLP